MSEFNELDHPIAVRFKESINAYWRLLQIDLNLKSFLKQLADFYLEKAEEANPQKHLRGILKVEFNFNGTTINAKDFVEEIMDSPIAVNKPQAFNDYVDYFDHGVCIHVIRKFMSSIDIIKNTSLKKELNEYLERNEFRSIRNKICHFRPIGRDEVVQLDNFSINMNNYIKKFNLFISEGDRVPHHKSKSIPVSRIPIQTKEITICDRKLTFSLVPGIDDTIKPFWLGTDFVSKNIWNVVMNDGKDGDEPVEFCPEKDISKFIERIKENSGKRVSLPSLDDLLYIFFIIPGVKIEKSDSTGYGLLTPRESTRIAAPYSIFFDSNRGELVHCSGFDKFQLFNISRRSQNGEWIYEIEKNYPCENARFRLKMDFDEA